MNVEQAMTRWQVGHHAFFVLLQGLILAHRRLESCLVAGDMAGARRALAQSARMLDGSGAAMRFAGDMPSECYVAVRQSMSPPHVPNKFSGLWSVDHVAMIEGLKSLKKHMANAGESLEEELQAWHDSYDRIYTAHACVCEHFVGKGPSLSMIPAAGECTRSALENIEAFRKRTLALVSYGNATIEPLKEIIE